MRDLELGRLMRALRRRRGWRQADCAVRAGVHRSTWSRLERGQLGRMTVETLRQCVAVLEVRLELVPSWRGADLARLLDETHARLQAALAERLRRWGWQVFLEVSFNFYGDRGRVDLVAYFAPLRLMVIAEIKSEIADAQGLLGSLDVKVRLAPRIAAQLQLPRPARVLPLLLVPDEATVRRRVLQLSPLFERFSVRGRAAAQLLRRPALADLAGIRGLLIFSNRSYAPAESVKSLGGHRVRASGRPLSVGVETTVRRKALRPS